MEIIVAPTAGFCFGVQRAVKLAFEQQYKKNTYTLGPIIHNETVIESLTQKGIPPVGDIHEMSIDTLIIRSHGVGKNIYDWADKEGVSLVDATCPYVKKIHRIVQQHFQKGELILLIGDEKHPEIIGINGWAENNCIIIKDVEALKEKDLDKKDKYLVVSQTTYKHEQVQQIISYLEQNNYQFEFVNTICNATRERQDDAARLAQKADAMIIIGSPLSANTKKLFEIAKSFCKNSYCVRTKEDLKKEMIYNIHLLGITAGASTPPEVIESIIQTLQQWSTEKE